MIILYSVAPQEYAGQQYVARILGLDPQSTFRYEHIGYVAHPNITNAYAVTSGFYAVCDVDSEGNKHESYHIITDVEREAAIRIAQRLDLGESIEQSVEAQRAAGDTEATAEQEP